MPVSLLTVGSFVEFPVSGGAILSYDPQIRPRKQRLCFTTRERAPPWPPRPLRRSGRLVVLVSGSGTNLQALLDAIGDDPAAYGAEVVAVGADRDGIAGLERAERAGLPTFVCRVKDYADRDEWDAALDRGHRRVRARPRGLGRVS